MDPERIERAARARHARMREGWEYKFRPWEELGDEQRARLIAEEKEAADDLIPFLFPELASGTHWIAPMEATEGMAKHAEGLTDFAYSAVVATPEDVIREWQSGYRLMRDAYLKAQG